jgi:hypothetical protein
MALEGSAMRSLILTCALAVWSFTAVSAGVVAVKPVQDNTLFEDPDGLTSNGAGPVLFAGSTGRGQVRRALMEFDVAGALPPGARIDSVALAVRVSNAPNEIPRAFTLHRVLKEWGEGASSATGGGGAPAATDDATWLHASYPGQQWFTVGGDFDQVAAATLLVAGVGRYTWSGTGMVADVASWVAQPATNHGWLVRGEETGLNTARRFESRTAADPADRPTLTIYYTGVSAWRPTTWGSVKSRYR